MKKSKLIRYFLRDLRNKFKFFLIKLKLKKGYEPNKNIQKINIGGGEWSKNNWENLDIIYNYKLEIELLKPFKDNNIDLIYTSHCIEHLSFDTTLNLLKDAYRVLKKNGIIRIVVPDVDNLLKIYNQHKNEKDFKFYSDEIRGNYNLKESILELFGFNLNSKKFLKNSMHLSFYNISSLKLLLIAAGFENFKIQSYGVSDIDEFQITREISTDGFDNPDVKYMSLYLEAKK